MLCQISLKYVQKPFQRNKPAKVQAYNGKIKCFIRKRALILLFTYIYRHWKANLTEVMIVEFNQGQRGLAGSRIFLRLPISTLWWKLCSQLCLWLWKSDFMSHNFKPPPHLVYKMKMQIFSLVVWFASFSCCSALSDSLWSPGLGPTRLLCPWKSPGKNIGVGCHSLLQGICLTQGFNLGLLHCGQILYHVSHQGDPWLCGLSDLKSLKADNKVLYL